MFLVDCKYEKFVDCEFFVSFLLIICKELVMVHIIRKCDLFFLRLEGPQDGVFRKTEVHENP
jgi:hypothetical protein